DSVGASAVSFQETRYRPRPLTANSSDDDNSDNDQDEGSPSWRQLQKTRKPTISAMEMNTADSEGLSSSASAGQRKRKNNIWGSVLQEQDLTQTLMKSGAVHKSEEVDYSARDVESYDFTKKYEDNRPDLDDDDIEAAKASTDALKSFPYVPHVTSGRAIIDYEDTVLQTASGDRRGKKRKADSQSDRFERKTGGVHDRLGVKKVTTMKLGEINLSEDMEGKELAQKIADFIHEPKVELIERVVEHMGKSAALRILQQTKDTEESGGMYTNDGSRRRTPGGVYLQLIKQQPEFTEVRKLIFVEDWQDKVNKKKQQRKMKKAKEREQKMKIENIQGQNIAEPRSRSVSNHRSRSGSNERSISNSRSHSGSKSRSRSREFKGIKDEEGMIEAQNENKQRGSRRNRSRNRRHRKKHYNDFDKLDESNSDSEGDGNSNAQGNTFNFEDELEAARKRILEQKNKAKQDEIDMEKTVADQADGDNNIAGIGDLDEEEANIVDIPLEME
ncbi:hypothetical protein DPMN_104383, partial [Dreissena polymorpha]